ncbi:MAG: hypothetical protein JEZ14_09525 [Marinilabiliaceae bacterium]|nr:hypothetical protein [Marinilabiliaceae bacterium]
MKKSFIARHNANKQVVLFLKKNSEKFAHIVAMVKTVTNLDNLVVENDNLATRVENIPAVTSGNKKIARADLVAVSLKVSSVLKVYAYLTKNQNLTNFVVTSESVLMERMPQQDFLVYCKNLAKNIAPLLEPLVDYGLTSEMAQELATEINDYETVMTQPREMINTRKTTNELIEDKLEAIYLLLTNQLDPFMELFKDDTELYSGYKAARMIVDPATRSRKEEEVEEE